METIDITIATGRDNEALTTAYIISGHTPTIRLIDDGTITFERRVEVGNSPAPAVLVWNWGRDTLDVAPDGIYVWAGTVWVEYLLWRPEMEEEGTL